MNRRQLIAGLGLATTILPAAARASEVVDDGEWALLHPFRLGQEIGLGWRLGVLESVERGAAVLNLHHPDGRDARVHVCARAGAPRGIAHTERLDLILMDGGDGAQATPEDLGRVLRRCAQVMAENPAPAGLAAHGERVRRYGPENLV